MKLTIFNGSPRHKKSNTDVFLGHFINGFTERDENSVEVHHIYPKFNLDELRSAFKNAEIVLLAFPLYADAMPSGVKLFIDALTPLKGRESNPDLFFFVQSGFPEAFHSRPLERYLLKLANRLGCKTHGCIIKGGGEGVKDMPSFMTKTVFKRFHQLGSSFARTAGLDKKIVRKIAGPEKFGPIRKLIYGWLFNSKLGKSWWHNQMKENDCLEDVAAQPYKNEPGK
jgi:multimeric flavodoxin WrbA